MFEQNIETYTYEDYEENDKEFVKRWRKHLGWKKCFWMDIHACFEKICVKYIGKYHETKIFPTSWRFKLASRIEFKLRKML